jgi:AbrB family looped-hinge helix DNA binding protein
MSSSKITSKYQATIPKEIRDVLHLKAGDTVVFKVIDRKIIVIKKAKPFDKEYLKTVQNTLTEWESENDEEAFEHLQDL